MFTVLADGRHDLIFDQAKFTTEVLDVAVAFFGNPEKQVFRADVFIVHGFGILLCLADDPGHFDGHGHLALALDGRNLFEELFQAGLEHGHISAAFRKDGRQQAFRFFNQAHEDMDRCNFLIIMKCCYLLSRLKGFDDFLCVFFVSHN